MKVKPYILPGLLRQHLPAIQELCRKHKVKRLWAFGSVLRDDFRADSDVDILYELDEKNISDEDYLSNFDGLLYGLADLFEGRKMDFVHYPSLKNPYFIEEVEATKVLLYEQKSEEVSV